MTTDKTIVIALGGNAILQPGQEGTVLEQLKRSQNSSPAATALSSPTETVRRSEPSSSSRRQGAAGYRRCPSMSAEPSLRG